MEKIRCSECVRLLTIAESRGEIICPRCKTKNKYDTFEQCQRDGFIDGENIRRDDD